MGKIITDRILNRGAVKNMSGTAWGNPDGLQVSDVDPNMFLFTFNNKEKAMEILNKTPWYVMSKLISLQIWCPHVAMNEIDFSRAMLWVQIQDLPLKFISIRSVEKIVKEWGLYLRLKILW